MNAAYQKLSLPRRIFTRDEYERMIAAGVVQEGEKVELLHGEIVQMCAQGVGHAWAIRKLNRLLLRAIGDNAELGCQVPFAAGPISMPEPDFQITPFGDGDRHPDVAWLVVEVADASLRVDRKVKRAIYAAASVPEYWIVDVVHRRVERYSGLVDGDYSEVHTAREGDQLTVPGFPEHPIPVAELFVKRP
jgi:Uma2 family endonuclease